MTRRTRATLGLFCATALFAAALRPSLTISLYALRETYRTAEMLGIMNPKGRLGGQVMGFNYQRDPAWVHRAAEHIAVAVGYGPALIAALLLFERVGFGPLWATLCGRCGGRLKGLAKPECPHCGAPF